MPVVTSLLRLLAKLLLYTKLGMVSADHPLLTKAAHQFTSGSQLFLRANTLSIRS